MKKQKRPKPTEGELAILQVLWERGPSTVRQVQQALEKQKRTGYTTTLKLMQIMLEKGHLRRDDSGHAHIYRAAISRNKTQRQIVTQVLDQAFNGSAKQLIMQALSSRKSTPDELAEIRELLDELEGDQK